MPDIGRSNSAHLNLMNCTRFGLQLDDWHEIRAKMYKYKLIVTLLLLLAVLPQTICVSLGYSKPKLKLDGWTLREDSGVATNELFPDLKIRLSAANGSLVSWKPSPFNCTIWVLRYADRGVGTKVHIDQHKGVVIDIVKRKVLAEAYIDGYITGTKKSIEDEPPVWIWTNHSLEVDGLSYGQAPVKIRF